MSQENSTSGMSKDTKKKLTLGGLLVVLAGVMYYQFFTGGDAPSSPPSRPGASNAALNKGAGPSPTPPRAALRTGGTPEPIISQPLDLASMTTKEGSNGGIGRNIFIFPPPPTPTPIPTPSPTPTPTPLPITIFSINPAGVIGRTGDFTLTVFGEKFPVDAQGFVDGRAYPTTFISATEAKIKVPAEAIRTPGNIGVMLRSQSNARIYSNQASLNVAAPPDPPYKYIGLIVSKIGATAVLKSKDDDDVLNVKKGDKIGSRWRITDITPQKIEIEDTNNKIKHLINYSGES
jgi:hypothetical protein